MSTSSKLKRIRWLLVLTVVGLLAVSIASCRDPEFELYDYTPGDYDPDDVIDEPAPLCHPGATQPINNSESPYVGGELATGLVVEIFTYFRCPNCAQLALNMRDMYEERQDFRDQVKVYFHHFPLYEHETVMDLHAAGRAIQLQDNEGFWEVHDWVFERLLEEPPVLTYSDQMRDYADEHLNLDMELFDEVFNDPTTWDMILWDKSQGEELGVLGTPGVFICGEQLTSWSEIEEAIEEYL